MNSINPTPIDLPIGTQAPPRLLSWLLWRDIFAGRVEKYDWLPKVLRQNGYTFPGTRQGLLNAIDAIWHSGQCAFCDGIESRAEFGLHYCLCHLLNRRESMLLEAATPHGPDPGVLWVSNYKRQKMDSFRTDIETEHGGAAELKAIKKQIEEYIEYPVRWLVLSGPAGVGKTHILNAILTQWYPWFVPLLASDFERLLRRGLEDNSVQDMMSYWINVPGLIIDDLGMEYSSPWIAQKLEDLIVARSSKDRWWDRVTVIATNIRFNDIRNRFTRDGVSRVGSRLMDTEIVDWIRFTRVGDFRGIKV